MKNLQLFGIMFLAMGLFACGQSSEEPSETATAETETATATPETQSEIPEDWESLSTDDFTVSYPADWELDESGQMGTSFILFGPDKSENDQFRDNLNLIIQDLRGRNIDLDKYVEISENQLKTQLKNGEILESQRITTKQPNYQKLIYTGNQGVRDLKFEQYYFIINEKAYALTLTCEIDQFDEYQEAGEKIMNSFSIKK